MGLTTPYTVSGIVYDTDGVTALQGVKVTATNKTTGQELQETAQSTTNSSGEYTIDLANFVSGYNNGDEIEVYAWTANKDKYYAHTIDTTIGVHNEDMTLSKSVTYTTSSKVARLLQIPVFTSVSDVTYRTVNEIIKRMEDKIDDITNHAWRSKTITDEFYHIENDSIADNGVPVFLKNSKIKALDTDEGDKVEIWEGDSYADYVTTKTEGRGDDFWLDYNKGILWIRSYAWRNIKNGLRMTYRYGETTVPGDIEDACTKMVAIDLITAEDRNLKLPEGTSGVPYQSKIYQWQKDIDKTLSRWTELVPIG